MNEKELREQAIKRYKNGEFAKGIYRSLGKSKAWFFKWLNVLNLRGKIGRKANLANPIKVRKGLMK